MAEEMTKVQTPAEQRAENATEKATAIADATEDMAAPGTEPVAPETPDAPADAAPDYKGDYNKRLAGRYADMNVDDEASYYGAQNKALDDLEGYEKKMANLDNHIQNAPMFAEMMVAARDNENFDPVLWAVETGQLDIDALKEDPEYAQKLADAQAKALDKKAKSKEIEQQQAENLPTSVEVINTAASELGLDDEQKANVIGKMYQIMDDLLVNKVDGDIFKMIANGMNFDKAVAEAREEGKAAGVNTKVKETLKKMPQGQERNGGTQQAMVENKMKNEGTKRNMFGL